MRVLMLGWDFSPRLSGGVGSACQGLATALTRASAPLTTEVLFVLPRVRGDEEPEKVRLLSEEDAPAQSAQPAAQPTVQGARERAAARRRVPLHAAAPPPLPSPGEALRLLAVDSPLRPYLAPEDYTELVRGLFARVRSAAPAADLPQAGPDLGPEIAGAVAVPPYGLTLLAEVERYARAVLALTQREELDVIHAHDWMTFPAGLLLQERSGKPLVVHFHSCEAERRGPLARREVRALEQAAMDAAERVVCVSANSARTLRAHYAVQPAKVRVVHNAFAPLDGEPRAHAGATPTVLYAGRLSEQKAPDVFLRAAALVRRSHPRARFVLAGEGELYPELVELARELELEDAVRFTGFVDGSELAATYSSADVYVLSSAAEPFGIGALEALSLGVPAIVPHTAGVTEVVRSALRFEPLDAEELADKIVALLERPALRRQLASAGLREVRRIRWDRPARALRGIYAELAGPAS